MVCVRAIKIRIESEVEVLAEEINSLLTLVQKTEQRLLNKDSLVTNEIKYFKSIIGYNNRFISIKKLAVKRREELLNFLNQKDDKIVFRLHEIQKAFGVGNLKEGMVISQ